MRMTCLLYVLTVALCVAQTQPMTEQEREAIRAKLMADLRGTEESWQAPPPPHALERPAGTVSAAQLRHKPNKNAQKLVLRAAQFVKAGNHQRAAEELEKAVASDPAFADAFEGLGEEYGRLGRYGEAETEFHLSLILDPTSWAGHYGLGVILYQAGDLSGAEQSARRALQLSESNAQVHFLLGLLLWPRAETKAEALEHLQYAAHSNSAAKELLASLEGNSTGSLPSSTETSPQ